MKTPTCLLILIVIAALAPAASAQGTVTIANGAVALQNNGQLATTAHVTITGTLSTDAGTTVTFDGSGTQNLTPAAGQTLFNLTLDKPSGNLVLMGNLDVTNLLSLTRGDLDLNGFQIDLGATGTLSETDDNTVKGASGTITATRTSPSGNVAGLGAEIDTQLDLGFTTITRGHTEQSLNGNASILRYFDISPTTNTGLDAILSFH